MQNTGHAAWHAQPGTDVGLLPSCNTSGSAVLPIFVLSLDGMPPGLEFEGGGLVHAGDAGAVVLRVCVCPTAKYVLH